jgi:GxxExxY protein
MTELLYSDLTGKIRQAAFEVHQYFGNGFLEKVYENSLAYKLRILL